MGLDATGQEVANRGRRGSRCFQKITNRERVSQVLDGKDVEEINTVIESMRFRIHRTSIYRANSKC